MTGALGNLLSGLFGAVVGALIGALWASHLQKRERSAQQKNAGKALWVEMEANYKSLVEQTLHRNDKFPYVDTAWSTQTPLIAGLLSLPALETVAEAYRFAPTALADGDPQMLRLAASYFLKATGVLSPLVLDTNELGKAELERKQAQESLERGLRDSR